MFGLIHLIALKAFQAAAHKVLQPYCQDSHEFLQFPGQSDKNFRFCYTFKVYQLHIAI
jgi:hypothetical protein